MRYAWFLLAAVVAGIALYITWDATHHHPCNRAGAFSNCR